MSSLRDRLRVARARKGMRKEGHTRRQVLKAMLALTVALHGARAAEAMILHGSGASSISSITNQRMGTTYQFLPQAINAAQNGDTLLLPAGLYSAPGIPYAHYKNTDSSAFGYTAAFNCMYIGSGFDGLGGTVGGFGPNVLTFQAVGTANNGRALIQRPWCRTSVDSLNTDTVVHVSDASLIHPAYPNDSLACWGENAAIQNVNGGFRFVVTSTDTVANTITGSWQGAPATIPSGTLLTTECINGQALFATYGNAYTFLNIEFAGAHGGSNSAAIRMGYGVDGSGNSLGSYTMYNCYVHDCQGGTVGNGAPLGSGVYCSLYGCEFFRCGNPNRSGTTHIIYTQSIDVFTAIGCYFHYPTDWHIIKSRARENIICYNRNTAEAPQTGNGSGVLAPHNYGANHDISDGGYCLIIGNMIEQGATSGGSPIQMNPEGYAGTPQGASPWLTTGSANPYQECYAINNTCVSNYNVGKAPGSGFDFIRKMYPESTQGKTSLLFPPEFPNVSTTAGGTLPQRTYFAVSTLTDPNGTETPLTSTGSLASSGQFYTGVPVTSFFSCGNLFTPAINTRAVLASPAPGTARSGWYPYLGLPPPPQAQLSQVAASGSPQTGLLYVSLTFIYSNGLRSLNFCAMKVFLGCYQQSVDSVCAPFDNTMYEQSFTITAGNKLKVTSPTGLSFPFTSWGSHYGYPAGNVILPTSGGYQPVSYEVWVGTASGNETLQTPTPITIGTDWTLDGSLVAGAAMTMGWLKQSATPIAMGAAWTEPTGGIVTGAAPPVVNNTVGTPQIFAHNNLLDYFSNTVAGTTFLYDSTYDSLVDNLIADQLEGGGPVPGFVDRINYNYSLLSNSAARNYGANPGSTPEGDSLVPVSQLEVWGLPTPGTPLPALVTRTNPGGVFDAGCEQFGI